MATSKKSTAKKSASRKAISKESAARKSASKKTASKTAAKKSTSKKSTRTYDPSVGERVGEEMDKMKAGTLRSGGGSGKKVTNPKQAIAIALSEKRREGARVPPNPNE